MKKLIILLTISTLSTSAIAEETSWLDSLKNFIGLGEEKQQAVKVPNTNDLVEMLTNSLDVNTDQASGGMGAIFNYVKNNVSKEQFNQLTNSLPGIDELVSQMPDINKLSSGSGQGLSGLLDKASQYSDSLKSINDVNKQFEALGLKPEMISSFISSAQSYLDTKEGQQAKQLLTDGLGKLLG